MFDPARLEDIGRMSNSIEPKKGHAGLRAAAMTVVASSSMAKLGAEARFKRNPKEVIQDLQKKHAFAMSDMEQGTTIGLILTGTRVKAVIPGSPGARPLVGRKLEPHDQILAVDDIKISSHDEAVEHLRGSNLVGTKVHLNIKRAATGTTEHVVCTRVPLNHVEHSQDMYMLLADARKLSGAAALIDKIEDKLRVLEDNNENTVKHNLQRIAELEQELHDTLEHAAELMHQPGGANTSGDENEAEITRLRAEVQQERAKAEEAKKALEAQQRSLAETKNELRKAEARAAEREREAVAARKERDEAVKAAKTGSPGGKAGSAEHREATEKLIASMRRERDAAQEQLEKGVGLLPHY